MLVGMLAWVVLFFTLLSYFLDAHVNEPLTSAGSLLSQLPDTRRLASVQHLQGSRPDLVPASTTAGNPADEELPVGSTASSYVTHPELLEGSRSPSGAPGAYENYLDPQSLAAWSSFGTENVGSHSAPAGQSRERASLAAEYQSHATFGRSAEEQQEEVEEENNGREHEDEEDGGGGNKMRTTASRRAGADSSNLDEYYLSKSLSVIQRLWRGSVSADMLSSRLQKAMKDYGSANKHRVSYTGTRRAARSAKELLCQVKEQVQLRTVDGSEQPFSSLGWSRLVPSVPLENLHQWMGRSRFRTCAVVSSAGAILRSGLGKEIGEYRSCVSRFTVASMSAPRVTRTEHIDSLGSAG